jgi:hypothetical protein
MLTININWEYFLAAIGTLIVLAYYANGRFTKLETNVEWLKSAFEALTHRRLVAGKRRRRSYSVNRSKAPQRSRSAHLRARPQSVSVVS